MDVFLEMHFTIFSDTDIQFDIESFTQRIYISSEALATARYVELINKPKFAKLALDKVFKTFVLQIAALKDQEPTIHSIRTRLLAALQLTQASTKISSHYTNYADVLSSNLAIELPKNIEINEYSIELIEDKQHPYGSIYSHCQLELKILKTYIETYLKTGFIQPSKFPAIHQFFSIKDQI